MFVQELAKEYVAMVNPPGIDWAALDANGHGLEVNGYDPAYMEQMLSWYGKFMNVVSTLDIEKQFRTIEAAEGRTAITQLYKSLNDVGAQVWDSIKQGDLGAAFDFSRPLLVNSVATVAAYASNGAYLHFDGAMEDAMRTGFMAPARVESHAGDITQIFQTFVAIDQEGGFDHIKRATGVPQAGLGFLPELALPAWALVTLGVTAVLGICYLVHKIFAASPEQDQIAKWCQQLIDKGGPAEAQYCIKAEQDSQNSRLAGLWSSVNILAIMAGLGVVVYAGALAFPHIARGLGEMKARG